MVGSAAWLWRALRKATSWWRNVVGPLKLALVEVVSPAERDDPPLSEKALEFKLLERELCHLCDELRFLVG